MYVLDHINDKDKDDPKIAIVPITCKIKVEPGMQPRVQGTSPEVPAPPGASEIGSLASGAAAHPSTPPSAGLLSTLAPIPAVHPTVHPTPTVHGAVPPTGAAFLLVGDGEEERENVSLLANPEDEEEEESVEDDGGIAEVAEVADEVVWAKDIF